MHAPIPWLIVLSALMVLILSSVRRIPEGHAYTLRRLGGHVRTVGAGLHLVLPLIERVAHKIRLLNNVVEIQTAAASGDLRGRVYFQVIDAERADPIIDEMANIVQQRIPDLAVSTCTEDDCGARNLHFKAELNRDFRGKDETTDVLSFPLLAVPLVEAPADELWQPDGDDSGDDAAAVAQWPDSADHGAAGLTDSDDDEEDATDDGSDGSDDGNDGDEDYDDGPLHLGDIAISRDAVVRQAAAAGHSVPWECAYLFAHGLLHLMGYDDSTDAGYRAMVAHQEAILTEAHITR